MLPPQGPNALYPDVGVYLVYLESLGYLSHNFSLANPHATSVEIIANRKSEELEVEIKIEISILITRSRTCFLGLY